MGQLLRTFNYPRNAFASTGAGSADKAHEVIQRVKASALFEKDEPFNDSKTFLGTVARRDGIPVVTRLGEAYEALYFKDMNDSWRWLVTRAMWRYSFPNGTSSHANRASQSLGVRFNFFDTILRLAWSLSAEPGDRAVLYFDELLPLLDDDAVWGWPHSQLYSAIVEARSVAFPDLASRRSLLGDLEEAYECGRDNMNTVFRKGLGQSGLFEFVNVGASIAGIRIAERVSASPVLWRRLRFVLDHPATFAGEVVEEDE